MGCAFYKDAQDGETVTLANAFAISTKTKNRWMVKSVHDADACPRFDAIATKFKDYDNPKEQVVISWYQYGTQDGQAQVGFSDVRLCNFLQGT